MRVFHIYPKDDPTIARYVGLLKDIADSRCEVGEDMKVLQRECQDFKPDIIHLHGCRNGALINMVWEAYRQGKRVVLTPHGQLSSWERTDHRIDRQQGILQKLVKHSYAVIARSSIEEAELTKIGWSSRIEIIPNCLLTRTTTAEKCLKSHASVYQKVMDSNVLELMDEYTLKALRTLLKVGIMGDERWGEPLNTDAINWHLLQIYTTQEGVSSIIERGLLSMGIVAPRSNTGYSAATPFGTFNNYLPTSYQKPIDMTGKPLLEQVSALYKQCQEGNISLLSLASLHQALCCDDVEDDVLMQQLDACHLLDFMEALMPVMREQTGLDEGFMPCQPIEGKTTKRIRLLIKEHLSI